MLAQHTHTCNAHLNSLRCIPFGPLYIWNVFIIFRHMLHISSSSSSSSSPSSSLPLHPMALASKNSWFGYYIQLPSRLWISNKNKLSAERSRSQMDFKVRKSLISLPQPTVTTATVTNAICISRYVALLFTSERVVIIRRNFRVLVAEWGSSCLSIQ